MGTGGTETPSMQMLINILYFIYHIILQSNHVLHFHNHRQETFICENIYWFKTKTYSVAWTTFFQTGIPLASHKFLGLKDKPQCMYKCSFLYPVSLLVRLMIGNYAFSNFIFLSLFLLFNKTMTLNFSELQINLKLKMYKILL